MITIELVMHVKEHEDWQLKVLQSWSQVFQNGDLILWGQLSQQREIHGTNTFLLPQIMLLSGWKQEH